MEIHLQSAQEGKAGFRVSLSSQTFSLVKWRFNLHEKKTSKQDQRKIFQKCQENRNQTYRFHIAVN